MFNQKQIVSDLSGALTENYAHQNMTAKQIDYLITGWLADNNYIICQKPAAQIVVPMDGKLTQDEAFFLYHYGREKKIHVIKLVRERLGRDSIGLKEAKDLVENWMRDKGMEPYPTY